MADAAGPGRRTVHSGRWFDDGTSGSYDLVVGADGVHSGIRALAFDEAPPRPVGQHGHRFVVDQPDVPPEWTVLLGRRTAFLMVPIGGGRVYCYCDSSAGERTARPSEDFGRFADPVPALLDLLDAATNVHSGPVEEVALDSWVRGRIVLIGDAAHATSPNMAEGAAMAMEDALVLAGCLVDAPDVERALAAFEVRRRPRAEWVRSQTHRRDRLRNLPSALRDPLLRRFGVRVYEANYRPLRLPT